LWHACPLNPYALHRDGRVFYKVILVFLAKFKQFFILIEIFFKKVLQIKIKVVPLQQISKQTYITNDLNQINYGTQH
jgi:hypothetical protein